MCLGLVGCFLLRTLLFIHRLNEFYPKQIKSNPQILETAQKNSHFSSGHCVISEVNLCRLLLLAGVMWGGEICALFCTVLSGILSARMAAGNDSFQQHSLAQLVITWLMTANLLWKFSKHQQWFFSQVYLLWVQAMILLLLGTLQIVVTPVGIPWFTSLHPSPVCPAGF